MKLTTNSVEKRKEMTRKFEFCSGEFNFINNGNKMTINDKYTDFTNYKFVVYYFYYRIKL